MAHDDKTRASLIQRLANPNDQQAWADFVRRYEPMIRSWCRRMGLEGAKVDDAIGDVFLALVKAFKTFGYDPTRGFRNWLRTVVNNATRDFFRKIKRERKVGGEGKGGTTNLEVLEQKPEDLVDGIVGQLESDLSKLDKIYAEAQKRVSPEAWKIFCSLQDEKPVKTVAAAHGTTPGNIHNIKYRVIKEMKAIKDELKLNY